MKNFNRSIAAVAVFSALGVSAPLLAAEADEAKVIERISVTGSRIKQVDLENSSPITVITAADINLSGEPSVSDVLNNLASNSFGSWTGVSGYGAGSAASSNINLRGLGSDATLVLLDGRRMPGTSSSSGASADTSLIPMSVVERIEILRDGASAVYGSSAVAGVINIITKKDFDGLNLKYEVNQPGVEGGDSTNFSVTTGYTSEKGNIIFTYEHSEADAIFDSEVWPLDDATYGAYSSYSPVSNYKDGNGDYFSNPDMCAQEPNVVNGVDADGSGRCFYNYGAVTKFYPDAEKNSFLTNFNYELTDNISFVGRGMASFNETDSRYAGTPVSTTPLYMQADNPFNPTDEKIQIYTRAVPIGNRDTKTEVITTDMLLGLEGFSDIGQGLDWEVNYQNSISKTNVLGTNLINDVAFQAAIDEGTYDLFNTQNSSYGAWSDSMGELYQRANHTGSYTGRYASEQIDGLVSTTLLDDGDFMVAGVVGVEFEQIDFTQVSDPESANGFISGGSGGDDVFATRERTAAYMELQATLPYNIDVTVAGRYESYEQTGTTNLGEKSSTFDKVVPKIGLTWRPLDSLLIRGSWGESFRAPNMGEMFQSYALSFPTVRDTAWCEANPGQESAGYCSDAGEQVATWFGGNTELQAETGDSTTVGMVWDIVEDFSVELTYYSINYEDRIDSVSNSEILRLEKEQGGLGSLPLAIDRNSVSDKIDFMYTGYVNKSSLSTDGIDFSAKYRLETSMGNVSTSLNISKVFSFEEVADSESEAFDYAGLQEYPEWKADLAVNYSYEDISATWTMYYVGAQDSGNEEYDVTYYADLPSYVKHNVQLAYVAPTDTKIAVGINNLLDKEAPSIYDGFRDYRDVNWSLYDLTGRSLYLRLEQSF
ncbi:TonB-dependent receptor [Psychrosphaera saromensis]|uniref:Ligand-gated channel protein n=1 Tax=Psychrosphaera saromensis TaxID=716813 RepID=A0A2S7UXY2_9GAMM|nr:TonB-dependent receptor [Psychrosphaera saromensis]PQJ54629.1 ligand-gated channel protein [Psychrosphaera saromensis]GHB58480.1 TonB-dependent receptor [Psychrosphaera saromensis]GLQ14151.1 TonB-dependent receptor [Psychrosphaera saromensis]